MRQLLSIILVANFLLFGPLEVRSEDAERPRGHSLDHPIVINASSSFVGILQEYAELDNRFGNYTFIKQSLLLNKGQAIDLIQIESDGKLIEIYFDISSWIGNP